MHDGDLLGFQRLGQVAGDRTCLQRIVGDDAKRIAFAQLGQFGRRRSEQLQHIAALVDGNHRLGHVRAQVADHGRDLLLNQ